MSYPHPNPVTHRSRPKPEYVPTDPLLAARQAAPETGRALSTFWRDVKRGILPAPYYVTPRAPRWRLSELRAAVDATRAGKRSADLVTAA